MFSENDLRFATERHKDMARMADQVRTLKLSDGASDQADPLWVRVLAAALDRSHWTLVPKSEFAPEMTTNAMIRFTTSQSGRIESKIRQGS